MVGTEAAAHVSERALVMLLPTTFYMRAGVAAVALTVLFLIFAHPRLIRGVFSSRALPQLVPNTVGVAISLASTAFLALLLYHGITGTRDPLENPLPVFIWSVWWILIPVVQALIGNVWHWLNPWRGLVRLLPTLNRDLPSGVGAWPALISFLAFAAFMTADPAPDDPDRLAMIIGFYWVFTFAACVICGERWLERGEGLSVLFGQLAKMAAIANGRLGLPGHALTDADTLDPARALLLITALGVGSFDGLNETFAWLGLIGVNPLEFPGRSAVMIPSLLGGFGAILTLACVLALTVLIGLRLIKTHRSFGFVFRTLMPSLIPIAIGYHIAHYLTSFLVGGQYAALAISKSMGGPEFYVTTGFFNATDSIRIIWLSQAGAIVIAHMLAVLVAHAIALRLFASHRKAVLSQLPMSAFMVAYTFFGLWILAQPTGA